MIVIDYQDRRPIYEQIVEKFQILILNGVLEADEQMPSVRKLAMELAINPNTIQKAYTMLEMQGYIYPVRGRGAFVAKKDDLMPKRMEIYWRELQALMKKGREIGVEREAFVKQVDEFFEKETFSEEQNKSDIGKTSRRQAEAIEWRGEYD